MKICHKKNFWAGAGMLALGILNLATALWRGQMEWSDWVLVLALVFLGGGFLLRGLSPKLAWEDKIEEQDERNVLVQLKTRTSAFRWARLVSFGLMLSLLIAGAVTGERLLLVVAVGLAFALTVSFFAEFFAALYHESKN